MRNKKHILFVCYGLGIGGIETCFVNLLNTFPESKFQIDVLLMNPEYELKERIKTSIRYLDSFRYVMNTTDTMRQIKEHGGIWKNLEKFVSYCCFRVGVKLQLSAWKIFKKLPDHYDVAVAYSQNDDSPYYVIDKVNADKKVMWYHNGAYENAEKKYKRDQQYYEKFDFIVAVSTDCKAVLQSKFNFPDGKLIVLRNICDAPAIREKANMFTPISFDRHILHLVTVGRMTKEKGPDLAVEVCQQLCNRGFSFQWHWVGDGNQREIIEKKVEEYGLQGCFLLEGNQVNPYPYIKYADIYVQPSYYEAYSTTVTEAKVLQKPIVVTDVGGMRDQIKHDENGLITSIDVTALTNTIVSLMDDPNKRHSFSKALNEEDFSSDCAFKKYEELLFS